VVSRKEEAAAVVSRREEIPVVGRHKEPVDRLELGNYPLVLVFSDH
jgi:hypothetical protein